MRKVVFAVFFIALFIAGVVWRSSLESAAWYVFAPLERARLGLGATQTSQLRAELAATTALVADRNALYQENRELKQRLGRTIEKPVLLAGVLLRPPGVPYDTFVVDAGIEEGVHAGDFVSAGGTSRIGVVSEVYQHTSRVILFSAPGQVFDVLLHASSTTQTVPVSMQGQGAGSFVGQVPAGTQVHIGDPLVFPGIASAFAGEVTHVALNPQESFITLYAHLPVDILSLQFVEIEKDSYAGQ